ncbi:MAG: DNA integrity scanning protein DisA nucleotide-binding domain protein [Clostridia bacterium]|nr:DNA integrity scanning protein DisA nucleotide-binding domain protein [Clostridia bacterium]
MYNFIDWIKNIDLYAIVDGVIFATIAILFIIFFAYKRHMRVLVLLLSVFLLDVLVQVLAQLHQGEALTVARYVMHYFTLFVLIVTAVVYQNDFKSIFQKVGNPKGLSIFGDSMSSDDELREATTEILSACQDMAKQDVGAIIIIDMNGDIQDTIIDSGTQLGAVLTAPLLESIFNTKAPLHDGAVIVRGNKIVAAGCFLPLTQRNVNKEMGTRHRAAIGITEETDVLSIVVSEETGIISVVKHGEIKRYMTMDKLKDEIEDAYGISMAAIARREAKEEKKHHGRL